MDTNDKTPSKRSNKQNKALHLFLQLLADELNNAGLDMKKVLKPSVSIDWNKDNVKEYLWKPVQEAISLKKSTTEMTTAEPTKVWEHLNRHLGEKFGVEVPLFPSVEQTESYIKSLENKE